MVLGYGMRIGLVGRYSYWSSLLMNPRGPLALQTALVPGSFLNCPKVTLIAMATG